MKSVKVGILGAAGYTGGELIRVLLGHPEVEIVFANSESNAGNPVSDVHEGLIGETDLCFTSEMPFDKVDVVFFCFGHGKSEQFLKEHEIPSGVKIIDLAQDFRVKPTTKDDSSLFTLRLSMVCPKLIARPLWAASISRIPVALPRAFSLPCCPL